MVEQAVWDPVVETAETNANAAGQAINTQWLSTGYELPTDEVIEIFRFEYIPPVNPATGLIRATTVELLVDSKPYETIHINSLMNPLLSPLNVGVGLDFGIPYLHRPILGRLPLVTEATCPKAKEGQVVQLRVTADEALAAAESYGVVLKYARTRTDSKLREVMGVGSISKSFQLDSDLYQGSVVPVSVASFDELPGGLRQSKPEILPWWAWAANRVATTVNTWYQFSYATYVTYKWQELEWNLVNKLEAYLIRNLSVQPNVNSSRTRLYTEGRITNPEYRTRPLPEENFFMPASVTDTAVNATLRRAGMTPLAQPILFHGVKGGINHIDNGAAVAINGVVVEVAGVKFILPG